MITTTTRRSQWNGTGSTGPFTWSWLFHDNDDVVVVRTTGGVDSTLVETTDYTLSGAGSESGGSLTLTSVLLTGEKLTVYREVAPLQETGLSQGAPFLAEVIEYQFDKQIMIAQQISDRLEGAVRFSDSNDVAASTVLPTPAGTHIIGWNSDGNALQNYDAADFATVTAYGTASADVFVANGTDTDFELSSNPGSLYNLDVSIGGVTQEPGRDYTWTGLIVTFTSPPPVGERILIRYMQGLPAGTINWDSVSDSPFVSSPVAINSDILASSLYDSIDVLEGGGFVVAAGKTLTIDVPFRAGLYHVFSGSGTISFAAGSVSAVHPEWWGYTVSTTSEFPYPSVPIDSLRGDNSEKFAIALQKAMLFPDTPNFTVNDRARTAFKEGSVTVVIVGDSITAGADNWRANTYVDILKRKLKQTFHWVTFKFVNLAIGGMSAGTITSDTYVGAASLASYNISTNYWFEANTGGANSRTTVAPVGYALLDEDYWPNGSTVGRSWKEEVVSWNPDIIVYAFGMNDGTDTNAFNVNYETFRDYIYSSFYDKPWMILVSCFLATKNPPAGQPHATWQIPGQSISDQLRYYAKRDGFGLIDGNSVFRLLRDGVLMSYTPFEYEGNWRNPSNWTFPAGTSFDAANSRAVTTGTGTSGITRSNVAARDIDFSATFTAGSFSSSAFVGRIQYRRFSSTDLSGYSADIVLNEGSTTATASLYYGDSLIKSYNLTLPSSASVGSKVALKVKCYGDRHEVWVGSELCIDVDDKWSCYQGGIAVGIPQGAGSISGLGLAYSNWVESPTHVDKFWLYGKPVYIDGSFALYSDFLYDADSIGGSVVNHPSKWSHNTIYGLSIMHFVNELKYMLSSPSTLRSAAQEPFTVTTGYGSATQKVTSVEAITISTPYPTKISVAVTLGYTLSNASAQPGQIGLYINNTWARSSYIPVGAGGNLLSLVFSDISVSAGTHTIELGANKAASEDVFVIAPVGWLTEMAVTTPAAATAVRGAI